MAGAAVDTNKLDAALSLRVARLAVSGAVELVDEASVSVIDASLELCATLKSESIGGSELLVVVATGLGVSRSVGGDCSRAVEEAEASVASGVDSISRSDGVIDTGVLSNEFGLLKRGSFQRRTLPSSSATTINFPFQQ
jgi:hypothetical protein